jgi:hypothetical protein
MNLELGGRTINDFRYTTGNQIPAQRLTPFSLNHIGAAKLAGMLDIATNIVLTPTLHPFIIKLMEHGIDISQLAPDINPPRR